MAIELHLGSRAAVPVAMANLKAKRPGTGRPAVLDDTDRRLLLEIQANARMRNSALADRLGISASRSWHRMRALEKAGLIKGYRAKLNEDVLGYGVSAYVAVKLVSQGHSCTRDFERRIARWQAVRECHALLGEVDYILKCVGPDILSLERFLWGIVARTAFVEKLDLMVVARESIPDRGPPIQTGSSHKRFRRIR
jgi:DNA-binding Lrp family transcriptional regulator